MLLALTKTNANTEHQNRRFDTIEKITSALWTALFSSAADFAAVWRDFPAGDWKHGLVREAALIFRSNGTSSPGVPEI